MISEFLKKRDVDIKEFKKVGNICIVCFIGIFTIMKGIQIIDSIVLLKNNQDLNHFKFIPNYSTLIKNVSNFMLEQEKKVYILDSSAAIYMIPLDRYNKDYDMFLVGNLGIDEQTGKIQDLEREENILVLILKDEIEINWQDPQEVRTYIKQSWVKVGEIEMFDIYEKY